jgi:hypothetical protein
MNRLNSWSKALLLTAICLILQGCAAHRTEVQGELSGETEKRYGEEKVDVLFLFSHSRQIRGLDAIPKRESERQILSGFDDIFFDALDEFSNLGSYASFTEYSSDVNDPVRRAFKDSLIAANDYVISMRISRETTFSKLFLGSFVSTVSATLIPIPYSRSYSMDTQVFLNDGSLVAEYHHEAKVTNWVEAFLIFVYPFHPETRKIEETYVDMLHGLFHHIDSEQILKVR